MAVTTGFTVNGADQGSRYVDKDYLLDVYPNLVPGRTTPGLWVIGGQSAGQSGLNTLISYSSPIQVGTQTNWKSAVGPIAVKNDGTLWALGAVSNIDGVLGRDSTIDSYTPQQIGFRTDWQYASAYSHALAVRTDGTLWAWGNNALGSLGTSDRVHRSSPTQVGSLSNWKTVTAISSSSFATQADGTLWAWGENFNGALGLNDTSNRSSPVQVGSLNGWKRVSSTGGTTLALKTDGTLWAWGSNSSGELGLSDTVHRSSPVQITGSWYDCTVASSSNNASCAAIKSDGTLWTWGNNAVGSLGLGNVSPAHRSSPVQVGSLTNWKQVSGVSSGGWPAFNAIKTDGTLWAWGYNLNGELGLGDTVSRSSPVQVGSLTTWKKLSGGTNTSYSKAIRDGYI